MSTNRKRREIPFLDVSIKRHEQILLDIHLRHLPQARGVALPYMGYIGMCDPRGYGFSAVLVINRVSNLADSGHK